MATSVAAVVAAGAFASPVGKWKGKVSINPKLPPNLTAEQKKQVDAQLAMIRQMTIEMDVKRDKTYTVKTVGGPQANKPETGKWSANGNKVKFTSPRNAEGQEMVLSSDKKTMTATIPSPQGQPPVKIVFTRV
jgi:hypothetical protein